MPIPSCRAMPFVESDIFVRRPWCHSRALTAMYSSISIRKYNPRTAVDYTIVHMRSERGCVSKNPCV